MQRLRSKFTSNRLHQAEMVKSFPSSWFFTNHDCNPLCTFKGHWVPSCPASPADNIWKYNAGGDQNGTFKNGQYNSFVPYLRKWVTITFFSRPLESHSHTSWFLSNFIWIRIWSISTGQPLQWRWIEGLIKLTKRVIKCPLVMLNWTIIAFVCHHSFPMSP